MPFIRRPARATRAKGPMAPRTSVTRATWGYAHLGLNAPLQQCRKYIHTEEGYTRDLGCISGAPRLHPKDPAGSTSYGMTGVPCGAVHYPSRRYGHDG